MPDTAGATRSSDRGRRGAAATATVAVFGVLAGLAGVEHGVGEILQGDVAPAGVVIMSWPGPGPFRVLGGEPAMTLVPNLLASGVLAVVASAGLLLVAVTPLARRRGGGPALIGLSAVMLLVGAGFGPPLLGAVVGVAATRIGAPPHPWVPAGVRSALATAWPSCLALALVGWLSLLPGTVLFERFVGMGDTADAAVTMLTASAFALLLLSLVTAGARDGRRAAAGPGPGVGPVRVREVATTAPAGAAARSRSATPQHRAGWRDR